MAQNRNRLEKSSGVHHPQDPASSKRDNRDRGVQKRVEMEKVSHQRSHLSPRERENDLYERQSI